jgi:SAM-dependent methyltransferase
VSEWNDLADWWREELASDPAYGAEVAPLLMHLLTIEPGSRVLELGPGTGWAMASLREAGIRPFGCELNAELAASAGRSGPVVRARLPDLAWCRDGVFDGTFAVLVLEHLENDAALFEEAARIVRPGGWLVLIANHPQITAPQAAPVVDPTDGEVFWRWGGYLQRGHSVEQEGGRSVTFYHRPLGTMLTAAAAAGWILDELVEQGMPDEIDDPLLQLQVGLPRLLGVRWVRR